jgi:C-terminal processing protease CtpA/Prc
MNMHELKIKSLFSTFSFYFLFLDTNNSSRPEPRMCSLTLRQGDTIGISLQPDKDFGHIIKQVEPNSLADRAGIERDDCIMSLNDTSLLNIPYEEVLSVLKKSRNDPNLDFLVAKKSYLLKSSQNNTTPVNIQRDTPGRYPDTTGEVMPSSNTNGKNTASASQALEQLYNKYNNEQRSPYDEQTNSNRPRETVSTTTTTTNDRLSPQLDNDRYASKQHGQILQGVGPATADRSSWGVASGKSADDLPAPISGDSSIRSNSRGRRPG